MSKENPHDKIISSIIEKHKDKYDTLLDSGLFTAENIQIFARNMLRFAANSDSKDILENFVSEHFERILKYSTNELISEKESLRKTEQNYPESYQKLKDAGFKDIDLFYVSFFNHRCVEVIFSEPEYFIAHKNIFDELADFSRKDINNVLFSELPKFADKKVFHNLIGQGLLNIISSSDFGQTSLGIVLMGSQLNNQINAFEKLAETGFTVQNFKDIKNAGPDWYMQPLSSISILVDHTVSIIEQGVTPEQLAKAIKNGDPLLITIFDDLYVSGEEQQNAAKQFIEECRAANNFRSGATEGFAKSLAVANTGVEDIGIALKPFLEKANVDPTVLARVNKASYAAADKKSEGFIARAVASKDKGEKTL
jgi:hypothetical protein